MMVRDRIACLQAYPLGEHVSKKRTISRICGIELIHGILMWIMARCLFLMCFVRISSSDSIGMRPVTWERVSRA